MPPASPAAPTLSDGTVTLRALSADDIPAIVEQSTDAETLRWTRLWEGYTRDDGREFVERTEHEWATGERHTWAVERDGRSPGLVGYRSRGEHAVEVSFAAHPAHRGRGVITRALRLALGHAFDSGAEVAFWHALAGNYGSRKVAWRLGFRISGPVTNLVEGTVRDFWTGRLLAGEPMEPSTRWLTAPTLEGDGFRLRPFRDDDASSMPAEPDVAAAAYSAGAADAGVLRDVAAYPEGPQRRGQRAVDRRRRCHDRRPARRGRRHPARPAAVRGDRDPRLLAPAQRARTGPRRPGPRARDPVCVAPGRGRRPRAAPAHRGLRRRKPCVRPRPAPRRFPSRGDGAPGHPGERPAGRRPGVRPAGRRRP